MMSTRAILTAWALTRYISVTPDAVNLHTKARSGREGAHVNPYRERQGGPLHGSTHPGFGRPGRVGRENAREHDLAHGDL